MATAVPEATTSAAATGAECSEPLHLILSDERLDSNELLEHDHLQQPSNCSMCTAESSSFQIRHFVSTVRERDFSKCWPFRQQILDKFISVGVRPFLPPLKQTDSGHALLILSALKKEILSENQDLSEENNKETSEDAVDYNCGEQDFKLPNPTVVESTDIPTSDIKIHSLLNEIKISPKPIDTEETSPSIVLDPPHGSEHVIQVCADGSDRYIDHSQAGLVDDLLVPKSSDEHKDTNSQYPHPCSHSDNLSMKDSNSQSPDQIESEAGSCKVVPAECSDQEDAAVAWIEVCTTDNNMRDQKRDEPCSLKSLNKTSDYAKEVEDSLSPSTERSSEHPARAEKSRIPEDGSIIFPTSDAQLIEKLCPVCLNFRSTSITALNAHIDQCLENVLPNDKLEERGLKNRFKSRKIRSMTEICAKAPARTLEDLERTAKQWALNDETIINKPSVSPRCFLRWEGLLIQRRCRTSLNRNCSSNWGVAIIENLGIKDSNSEVEHSIEYKQKKVEKTSTNPHKEMLRRRSSTRLNHDMDAKSERPINDDSEHCIRKPSKSSNMVSYSPLEKVSPHKKRKRSGPLTLPPSLQNLQSSEECLNSTEEQDDSDWPVSHDHLDFTPIDTSADEEKRLLMMQKNSDLKEEQSGLKAMGNDYVVRKLSMKVSDKYGQKHVICPTESQSVKPTVKHHTRVLPSVNENLHDSPRKRKFIECDNSDSDNDARPTGDDTAVWRHLERSVKNKRMFPKIKSLGTLKDTAGDKFKNRTGEQSEMEKSHANKLIEKLVNQDATCSTDDESSYNDNVEPKHQSPQYLKKCLDRENDSDELEQSISSKEHVQSAKSSSITACPVLAEHASEDYHANHGPNEKESNNRNALITNRDTSADLVHEESNVPVAGLRYQDSLNHRASNLQEFRKVLNSNPGCCNTNDLSGISSNAASGESGVASGEISWRERVLEAGTSPISSKKSSIVSGPANASCFVEDLAVLHPIKMHQKFHIGGSNVNAREISNSLASSGESFALDSGSLQQVPDVGLAGGKERWVAARERFGSQAAAMSNSSVDLGIPQDSSKRTDFLRDGQNAQYGRIIGKTNFLRGHETGKIRDGTPVGTLVNTDHSRNNGIQKKSLNSENCCRDSASSKAQYSVGYETGMPGSTPPPCTQRLSLQNDIYDLSSTTIGKAAWGQYLSSPQKDFISGKLSPAVQHVSNIHIGSSLNSMSVPVQNIPATVHHQLSSDAFQAIRGRSSNIVSDQGNTIATESLASSNHHKPASTLTICNDIPSVHSRRDSLSTPSISSYGSVEISGDQAYVFKLMGQNVMVTNSNVSSLGDQNGLRGFHPSTSISRLGLMQDAHTPYSHMTPELPSTSQLDAYKSRNGSLPFRSPDGHHCALPNLPPKQVGSFQPHMYSDPPGRINSSGGQVPGERANVFESFHASHSPKPPSIKSNNKLFPEVRNGGFLPTSGGSWFQGGMDTRDNSINQPNGRSFPANNSLNNGRPVHMQGLMSQYSSSECYPDINKVGLVAGGKIYVPNEQSGTLADIVNCSERSINWQVPGAVGDCFEAGNQ